MKNTLLEAAIAVIVAVGLLFLTLHLEGKNKACHQPSETKTETSKESTALPIHADSLACKMK